MQKKAAGWRPSIMAAPIQTAQVNCNEQNLPNSENSSSRSSPDLKISSAAASGNVGLKNGTDTMEEGNSEDVPDDIAAMNSNKVMAKSPNQGREVTMENFQDGEPPSQHQHQAAQNLNAEQSGSGGGGGSHYHGGGMDGPRINSDINSYSHQNAASEVAGDDYGKMNDHLSHGSPYGGGGYAANRANYMGEQHGGAQMPGNVDLSSNSQSNAAYSQFASQTMRPGYPQPSKAMAMIPVRPTGTGPNMTMMPSYNAAAPNPAQQRFLAGPNISQHGGPTPTLNQLLQSPNPVQRYQNNYSDYGSIGQSGQKGLPGSISGSDLASSQQAYPGVQNWNSPRGLTVYPQQMNSGGYRNQGGPLHDMSGQPAGKRPVQPQPTYLSSNPSYGAAGVQSSPQPPQGQYGSQYPQRYPSPQGRSLPMSMGSQPYSPQVCHEQLWSPVDGKKNRISPRKRGARGRQCRTTSKISPDAGLEANEMLKMGPQYPQQGPPPMSTYDQRPMQGYLQQQHSPQSYHSGRPQPQQQPTPQQPPTSQPPQQQHSPVPPPQQPGTPQPSPLSQQQVVVTTTAASQNKDGCDLSTSSSSNEISGPIDDAQSENSNQSLGSNSQGPVQTPSQGPQPGVSPLRPTPSPSGSSGSRSMSPAVGVQSQTQPPQQQNIPMPPRPSSSQSDSSQGRMSQSPMAAQGYNQPMTPSHMGPPMYGSKMHPSMMAPFSPQSQPYSQGNYGRAQGGMPIQGYNSYHGNHPNSMGHPYTNRMASGHIGSGSAQGYPGPYTNSQYGNQGYSMGPMPTPTPPVPVSQPQQVPTHNSAMIPAGKGGQVPTGAQVAAQAAVMAAAATNSVSAQPRHSSMFIKQQLQQHQQHQQQRGYGPGSGPGGSPQMNYSAGPPGMQGPSIPSMLGPPMSNSGGGGSRDSPGMPVATSMPPPATPTSSAMASSAPLPSVGPPQSSAPGHPPPSSTPSSTPPTMTSSGMGGHFIENSCDTSNESNPPSLNSSMTDMRGGGTPGTFGGTNSDSGPMHDEASQHSTASNASTADERAETPRPRKDIPVSHPPTPASALPSPGAASMSSYHDDFESVSSPSWPRTPASPVVNSQPHEYHPKRPDGLHKLYDLSDEPERRIFLDHLIQFNEERGSAIAQCPTISKHPLDLFRLYIAVKERSGFLEVTKSKLWKEVAGFVGVGASSSAAYTLRKQYIKHLLPFECKFDRGGIDPQPIISQVESNTRKKPSKASAAPSPGSSNSQDSFQQNNSQSMDGFPTPPTPYGSNQYSSAHAPTSDYGGGVAMGPNSSMPMEAHHPGMMPNHSSHPPGSSAGSAATTGPSDSINVQNPFADDIQHVYPRNGMPGSGMHQPGMGGGGGGGGSGGGGSGTATPYGFSHQRPQGMSAPYGASNQASSASPYSYPEQISRSGPPQPPQAPQAHDQYSSEQYRRQPMVNHDSYPNRPMPEQYGPAPGASAQNYPPGPGRSLSMQSNPPSHYGYGGQYERDRYEQQSVTMPQPQGAVMPPQHSQPNEQSMYPQHRYGTQQAMPRPYPGPTSNTAPSPQAAGPNAMGPPAASQGQPTPPTMPTSSYQPSPAAPQDPSYQNYTPSQPGIYQPPNKLMPPHSYVPAGPKRHPDFLKPAESQYPQYSAPPASSQTPQTSASAPVIPGAAPTSQQLQASQPPQQQPQPSAPYSGWRNESQYAQYPPQSPSQSLHPSQSQAQPQTREEWDHRNSRAAPDPSASQWPAMHQRYPPPPSQSGPPGSASVQSTPPSAAPPATVAPHPGYYYQGNSSAPPHGGVQGSPPNASLRMRMPMMRDSKQPPFPPVPQHKLPPPQMTQNVQYPPKRDIVFPPNSVEAVTPLLVKRKRLSGRDISPIEAWRIMMALKSGLLCESTWALDVLSVLLYDDATVLYFNLQHLPGLLEVLLEHYRRCLIRMFGLNEDLEFNNLRVTQRLGMTADKLEVSDTRWYDKEVKTEVLEGEGDLSHLGAVNKVDLDDKHIVLEGENFTYHTRRGTFVKVLQRTDLFVSDDTRLWDTFDGFDTKSDVWKSSGGDAASHIHTHFEKDSNGVSYVRVMCDVVRVLDDEDDDDDNDDDDDCNDEDVKVEIGDRPKITLKEVKSDADAKAAGVCDVKCAKMEEATVVSAIEIRQEPHDDAASESAFSRTCDKSHLDCSAKTEVSCLADGTMAEDSDCGSPAATTNDAVKEEKPKGVSCASPASSSGASTTDSCKSSKRLKPDDFEDEAYTRDEPSLCLLTDAQDSLARRCLCISNILRSLSFVPGNDAELSKSPGFLLLLGKLLLLHHDHAVRRPPHRNYDKEDETDLMSSCSSLHGQKEWWWDTLHSLRENTLVTLANIAGQLDLSLYSEEISLPILDGLLHWGVCPSAYAQDPLPTLPPQSILSPHRLSLEALCKLSVQENNVDLVLATPPFSRIERLFSYLARSLGRHEEQVVREFAVVLLHYFAQADSSVARAIALQNPCISLLIAFIEQAEQSALNIANAHGIGMLRDNPDMMGTSLDMLRRAAHTLLCLARVTENKPLFVQHQHRLLQLVTSQILDQHVASIVSDVLYECSLTSFDAS